MWRKFQVLMVAAGFVGAACGGASVAADTQPGAVASGTVWATERTPGNSSVTAFDAATGRVLGTTAVGSRPIGVTSPHGSKYVYSSDESANQL